MESSLFTANSHRSTPGLNYFLVTEDITQRLLYKLQQVPSERIPERRPVVLPLHQIASRADELGPLHRVSREISNRFRHRARRVGEQVIAIRLGVQSLRA